VAVAGERGAQPGLHLVAQAFLKLGIAAKTELGDEAGHRRRAHARALGEPRDALQAGDGIAGQEDAGEPALRRAQAVQALAHDLTDPRAPRRWRRDICYILAQSSPLRNVLDTR